MKISDDYSLGVFTIAFAFSGAAAEGSIPDDLLPLFMFLCGAIAIFLFCEFDN